MNLGATIAATFFLMLALRLVQPAPTATTGTGDTSRLNSVAISPANRWIAAGSGSNSVLLWEARTGTVAAILPGPQLQ